MPGPGERAADAADSTVAVVAAVARLDHTPLRPREISADAMTLPRLAAVLSSVVDGDVEDRTGLPGDFTIRLTWTSDPSGPSLFTAVEQQLGLRLVRMRSATQ
jgi:uncharacterized protein (TIGR03435 family)